MGGLAFAHPGSDGQPPLQTPRMPPKVYQSVSATCLNVIKEHYRIVEQLLDAPEKKDFGDVDFLVQDPFTPDANEHIARRLKAERTLTNTLHVSLAIPRYDHHESHGAISPAPESHSPAPEDSKPPHPLDEYTNKLATELGTSPESSAPQSQLYAQVDIRHCPTNVSLHWIKFCHSYGDLGQILGYLSRDLGITSNEKGFHVRIAEQETWDWKASMIFLSNDPVVVTRFLGLDWKVYCAGFKTEEDLFNWIRNSKTAISYPSALPQSSDVREVASEASKANAKHKRRMYSRPLFARFITEILPSFPAPVNGVMAARRDVLQEALTFFGKQDEYDRRLLEVRTRNGGEVARLLMMKELTEVLGMTKDSAREIVRVVKRWGSFVDGELSVRDTPAMDPPDELKLAALLDSSKDALSPEAVTWIRGNMQSVKELDRRRAKNARAEKGRMTVSATVHPGEASEVLKKTSVRGLMPPV